MSAVAAAQAAREAHVFVGAQACICGFVPEGPGAWQWHLSTVAVAGVAEWLATRSSPLLVGELEVRAADWAARVLREGG